MRGPTHTLPTGRELLATIQATYNEVDQSSFCSSKSNSGTGVDHLIEFLKERGEDEGATNDGYPLFPSEL